jgi:hypothetical protein
VNDWKSDLRAIKKNLAASPQSVTTTDAGKKIAKRETETSHARDAATAVSASAPQLAVPEPRPAPRENPRNNGTQPKKIKQIPSPGRTQPSQLERMWIETKMLEIAVKAECKKIRSDQTGRLLPSKTERALVAPTTQVIAPLPVPASIQAVRKVSAERQKFFREAADWVGAGTQTQLSANFGAEREIDIVIGIDFGTSYTKAAVGMLDKIYPVDWSGVSNCQQRLLLPSEYTFGSDGRSVLGQRPDAKDNEVKLDIKLPFIDPPVSPAAVASASVFLALVLRYVRAWIYRFHQSKIGGAKIRWQLNLGAPCNGLEDDRLKAAFRRVGNTAWLLSQRSPESGVADAVEIGNGSQSGKDVLDLFALDVFPEFVAQMAGYVQSAQRQRGLHALTDVGGGTLDVVTFIVHQIDHEDTFPFLVPEVRSLGTHMLNQNRIVGASLNKSTHIPDELMPVLDAASFSAATSLELGHVKSRDKIFYTKVGDVVKKVLAVTKARRYRRSEAWNTGLRTFLTGGGASAEGYGEAVKKAGLDCGTRLELLSLPLHPRLADFTGSVRDYQRISVACGLAQDAFSLGRIIPAKDVEDDSATTAFTRQRLDRDEVYAK